MMERPAPSAIPATPGVYIYKDAGGRIIYVGKARNLRRRVLSYFRPADQLTAKTAAMIGRAAGLEFLTTTTEKEALLLEASSRSIARTTTSACATTSSTSCSGSRKRIPFRGWKSCGA